MNMPPNMISLREAEIRDARRMTFEEKFWAGAELFDYACSISLSGIRSQHPTFNEEQVQAELRRRVELGRRREARQ